MYSVDNDVQAHICGRKGNSPARSSSLWILAEITRLPGTDLYKMLSAVMMNDYPPKPESAPPAGSFFGCGILSQK